MTMFTISHRLASNTLQKSHIRCLSPIQILTHRTLPYSPSAKPALSGYRSRLFSSTSVSRVSEKVKLKKTDMYDLHIKKGAKMVPYGGYLMPISYDEMNHGELHNYVRQHAGLFDVSHMVQMKISGATTTNFLHRLTPASLTTLPLESIRKTLHEPETVQIYGSTLTVLLNESGGIIDDLIITRWAEDEYYLVTNASRKDRDIEWIEAQIELWNADFTPLFNIAQEPRREVKLEVLDGWGLLALQGPAAHSLLQRQTNFDCRNIMFGRAAHVPIELYDREKIRLHVARGGYTGEDGFEISCPPKVAPKLAQILLDFGPPKLAGLAVRDSLRIEAGLCLYGNELDEDTTPNEASLTWVIGKSRRPIPSANAPKPFIGYEKIRHQLNYGPPRRRVGMVFSGGAPARQGAKIYASPDATEPIGTVTSGIPSPTLKQNIAMGYILSNATSPFQSSSSSSSDTTTTTSSKPESDSDSESKSKSESKSESNAEEKYLYKKGSTVYIDIRGRRAEAQVVSLPFVKHKYFKGIDAYLKILSDEYRRELDPEYAYLYADP